MKRLAPPPAGTGEPNAERSAPLCREVSAVARDVPMFLAELTLRESGSMRLTLAALLSLLFVVLSGCIDTDKPRRYECSTDSGVSLEQQCPGRGWICGLEGTCRDPAVPGDFLCSRDASISFCASGWFCTVEGKCRSLDEGGEFPCSRTNPSGDPKDGGQPNDCGSAQWWCGASGQCHQLGAEKAYRCKVDNDCEGSWRCSPDGVCVPPPEDGLRLDAGGSVDTFELKSPLLSAAGATHLAVGTPFAGDLPDGGVLPLSLGAAYADGGISALLRYYAKSGNAGVIDLGSVRVVATSAPVTNLVDLAFADLRAYSIRRSSSGGLTFETAGVDLGPPIGELLPMQKIYDLPPPFTLPNGFIIKPRLRISNRPGGKVVAFTPYGLLSHEPGFSTPLAAAWTPLPGSPGTQVGLDLAWLGADYGPGQYFREGSFLLSTERGVFLIRELAAPLSTSRWYALGGPDLQNGLCGDPKGVPPAAVLELRTQSASLFAARVTTKGPNGRTDGLSVYATALNRVHSNLGAPTDGGSTLFPEVFADGGCQGPAFNTVQLLGPCEPCPGVFPRLVDFRPDVRADPDGGVLPRIDVRCERPSPDGGPGPQRSYLLKRGTGLTAGDCSRDNPRDNPRVEQQEARFIAQTANSQKLGRVEVTRGAIFFGETEENLAPVFMDRVPVMVIEGRNDSGALLAGSDFLAQEQPNVGLLSLTFPLDAQYGRSSSVEGFPSWLASTSGVYELLALRPRTDDGGSQAPSGRLIAYGTSQAPFVATVPTNGVVLHTADGGRELTLSAFDSIYSADVTAVVDTGNGETALELRNIPFARSPILSLAAGTPAPDAGLFALSYANTQNGLFEVRAETRTRWRASDVILPEEVVQVFTNGRHARAGFPTGRIAALPSRLIIAEPLEAAKRPAVSYVGVCGQPWVLAAGGLFKLVPGANGAIGKWEEVPLRPPANLSHLAVSTPSDLYLRGRLHFHGGSFWVFLADGTTYRAEVSCPNGQ